MKAKTKKKILRESLITVLTIFSIVCGVLQIATTTISADNDDFTITNTIYNYYSGTWDNLTPSDSNVTDSVDSYGNGTKAYKYLYNGETKTYSTWTNVSNINKETAGAVTLYSVSTGGQTWHITNYSTDIDVYKKSDWSQYRQPKVTLRCNGTDIYTLQEKSDDECQNGSGWGLDLTCNGTMSWYSYGYTGDGRDRTGMPVTNTYRYYVITETSDNQSDWVWNTTYISSYKSGTVNGTGYVAPTYTLDQNLWSSTPYTKTTYTGDYVKGTTVVQPISTTVTFNGNGATGSGATYNDFTRVGYTLNDTMYTNSNGTGSTFSRAEGSYANLGLKENLGIVLYASWTANTYTITFNANGGENAPSNITKTYDTDIKLPTKVPTKEGYIFKGWEKDGKTYQAGDTLSEDLATENNTIVELKAIWVPTKYDIIFDANGGENAPANVVKTYGTDLTLPAEYPTREGYDFYGWSLKQDTIEKGYMPSDVINKDFEVGEDKAITLYAVWVSRAYVTLVTQDVYIKLNYDQEEAVKLALSYQNVSDINYDISKDDIIIKSVVYEDGTATENPSTIDTSKVQTITVTYAVTGNDGKERTSTSYIYIYVQAVDEEPDSVDEPTAIFGRFVDCDMVQYGIFYDDSIYKRNSEYNRYLQSMCESEKTVKKTVTVERTD